MNIKKKIIETRRKLAHWLIRKTCTKAEWKTFVMVKAGYYEPRRILTTFEVTQKDHELMCENQGKPFNERYCVTRRLLMDREEQIGLYVDYGGSYDPKREKWVYNAELRVQGGA